MNAREELIEFMKENFLDDEDIEAADLVFEPWGGERRTIVLPQGHTPEQWAEFLRSLDFNYYEGYGSQELFGTLWFKGAGGAWAERAEYDGSEWWSYRSRPIIPQELRGVAR